MLARVSALLFFSGFCALVYQMVWLRMLRLVFGASHAANAAVLAIFMGGLGLGGLLLGRLSDRAEQPLRLYGRLELGITLAAALSPLLIDGVRWVYVALGGTVALGPTPGAAVRLGLSALVLALPTVLMGGTLPAVVRAVERSEDVGRRGLGVVYGANTAGAVTGAVVAVFFALEAWGARGTLALAAGLNLLVALAALRMKVPGRPVSPRVVETASPVSSERSPERVVWVPVAAGAVGFAFLLMELVWSRMLSPILGGSTYTIGLILAVALAGIGAGGLLYGAGRKSLAATPRALAFTCALEAAFIAFPLALGDRLALLAAFLRPLGETGFVPLVGTWTVIVAVVVLPASVVSGYQFPLLVALMGRGDRKVGAQVGLVYAANTVGGIVGSLSGGFGVLPLFGAVGTWRLVVLGLAGLSGVVLLRSRRNPRALAVGLVAAVAVALVSTRGPTAVWRHSPIGAGRFQPNVASRASLEDQHRTRRRAIAWEVEGVEASVALDARYGYAFVVNGKSDGHVIGDAPTFVMLGLVGALLHPDPRTAMVVGLGTGETAGWLARVGSMERVDVVELEPAIAEVARLCAPVNFSVMDEPKVRHFPGDAREFLLTTDQRYDVIVNNPSNPYRAGIASLFTVEFYETARDRLTDNGVFVQWVQAYDLAPSTVRTIMATLGTVFPEVEVYESQTAGDLMLVASRAPVVHDIGRLTTRLGQHPYRQALSWTWGVEGVEGFYSTFIANRGLTRAMVDAEAGRVNTDDRPFIEYEFARNVGAGAEFSIAELVRIARERGEHRPNGLSPDAVDWGLAGELRHVRGVSEQIQAPVSPGLPPDLAARARARSAWSGGDLETAARAWPENDRARAPLDRLMRAETLAWTGHPDAEAAIAALEGDRLPTEVAFVRAHHAFALGEDQLGRQALVHALDSWQTDAWGHGPVLQRGVKRVLTEVGRDPAFAAAVWARTARPWPVSVLEEYRHQLRIHTAQVLDATDGGQRCAAAFGAMEPDVPWDEGLLMPRAACYARVGDDRAEAAVADLGRFRAQRGPALDSGLARP